MMRRRVGRPGLVRTVAPAPAADLSAELERLASLKASGALNDDEFAQAKAKLLA